MKLLFSVLIAFLVLAAPANAQNKNKKAKAKKASTTISTKSVRGAGSVEELGRLVFDAFQNNRMEQIEQYFPTETDLNSTEKKTPDEDLQLILEDHSLDAIRASFISDFQSLQNQSIEQPVNLQEISLMEVQAGAPQKANRLVPVNLILSSPDNQTMGLTFEALKINGRFFLFQHIGIKK